MAILMMLCFIIFLAMGVPVSFTLGLSGLIPILAFQKIPAIVVAQKLFKGIDSFPMMAIPFFILAGDLMSNGGITNRLMKFSHDLVGHLRGGLGHVNVLVGMLFAGISGSALADAAGPGAVQMQIMRESGYDADYSGALTASAAIIGPIIPPSIIMVIYAVTEPSVSIAALFMAGFIPGIMMGLALILGNYLISIKRNYVFRATRTPLRELLVSTYHAIPVLLLPLIIIGGILSGIFTATESAAVATAYAIVVGMATRNLKLAELPKIVAQSGIVSSAVLFVVSSASIFAWLIAVLRLPQMLVKFIGQISSNQLMFLFVVNIFLLIIGTFLDTLPAVLILVPVLAPMANYFHVAPVHFAIIVTVNLCIGMATPPHGPVLFVVSSVSGISIERLSKAIVPFLLLMILVLFLVTYIPAVTLTIPRWAGLISY